MDFLSDYDHWLDLETPTHRTATTGLHDAPVAISTQSGVLALDAQFGIWPKKNLPDALAENLFGKRFFAEADASEKAVAPRTFAILDASKVKDLPRLLDASGLPYLCLFRGTAATELSDVAPYIVELDSTADFVRRLFTASDNPSDLWLREPGIFLRSHETLKNLQRLLRRFTRVRDEAGNWSFFRFWEPEVAKVHFNYLAKRPKLFTLWFCSLNGHAVGYIVLTKDGEVTTFTPNSPCIERASAVFTLETSEKEAFRARRVQMKMTEIQRKLEPHFTARSPAEIKTAVAHVVERFARFGLKSTATIFTLAWYELKSGPAFENRIGADHLRELEQTHIAEDLRIMRFRAAMEGQKGTDL